MSLVFVLKMVMGGVGVLLAFAIMLQPKSENPTLLSSSNVIAGKFERRGPEKVLHLATLILGTLFVLLAFFNFILA